MSVMHYQMHLYAIVIDWFTCLVSPKVWDVRNMAPVMEVNVHSDFISDMTDNGRKTLIVVRSVKQLFAHVLSVSTVTVEMVQCPQQTSGVIKQRMENLTHLRVNYFQ